ncbi:MAG: hypothetical protein Dbin4_03114, partial [Alphaproteobacteria bacterium]|nr:hypothetical protein [Alphaproteobacteria bacterium]
MPYAGFTQIIRMGIESATQTQT